MGVMTSEDLPLGRQLKKDEKKKDKAKQTVRSVPANVKEKWILDSAPMGESRAAFYDADGKEIMLELKDKEYELPVKLSAEKKARLKETLIYAGFRNATEYGIAEIKHKVRSNMVQVFGHPDNAPNAMMNCRTAVHLSDGTEQVLEVVDGVVHAETEMLAEALRKAGFYFVREYEIKKDEDNPPQT